MSIKDIRRIKINRNGKAYLARVKQKIDTERREKRKKETQIIALGDEQASAASPSPTSCKYIIKHCAPK